MAAALAFEDVTVRFGGCTAVADTRLEVAAGEFVSVVGPATSTRSACSTR